MSGGKYLNVQANELNIGDVVQGRGRVARNPEDHETLSGYVTVVFEKRDDEKVEILKGKALMRVRCEEC